MEKEIYESHSFYRCSNSCTIGQQLQWHFATSAFPNNIPIDAVPTVEIPELDWASVFAEDAARSGKDEAPRFAIPHEVHITPRTDGIWERIDGRTMRWSLRVHSEKRDFFKSWF